MNQNLLSLAIRGLMASLSVSAQKPTAGTVISTNSARVAQRRKIRRDRKSTRLNSSHGYISYAVFCLKKKKKQTYHIIDTTKSEMRVRYEQTHRLVDAK